MRIAIGMFSHETNTFRAGTTPLADFQRRHWTAGEALLGAHRGVRDDLGGMIAAGERLGVELAPLLATTCEPSATIAREAYETIRDELVARIRAAGELDAICLAMHGAGVAEGVDDLEGTLLAELRAVVGPDLPLLVTLDLHGNLSQAMVEHATLLLGCHLYPHTDSYERGEEAVELATRIVRGELRPVTHLASRPMMLPPSTTMLGPAAAINELCWEWEAAPGIVDVAFFHGFPHTDIPEMTMTVVATADGDASLARRAGEAVAEAVWQRREEFRQQLPGPAEAIAQALASAHAPVVLAEVSDNAGGGAPADGTHLLRAMLDAGLADSCFGFISDPQVAAQAHAAGVGAEIAIRLGGKADDLHGAPIETTATVRCLTDGRFRLTTPMGRGSLVDLGRSARLRIGGVDVIVTTGRSQTLDSEVFLLHGIDVTRYRIVALKSQQHFRAGFAELAGEIIRVDSPGSTTATLALLPFQRVRRPIWPLDAL